MLRFVLDPLNGKQGVLELLIARDLRVQRIAKKIDDRPIAHERVVAVMVRDQLRQEVRQA